MPTLRHSALLAALALLALPVARASAQEHLKPISEGDGRIHGAPSLQVSEQDLHPGQVQTMNLAPGRHTVLEFPYPVARIDAGDPEVFSATVFGNKVFIKALRVSRVETSMSIVLADASLTVLPYLVRADSTQPTLFVVRYVDPVSKHLNQAEASIASRLAKGEEGRVSELAELRLQQRLIVAGDVTRIGKSGSIGTTGDKLEVTIESAQQFPTDEGRPRTYIRYRVVNGTIAPLEDLHFIVRLVTTSRRGVFFSHAEERELADVQDARSTATIPAGGVASGLLMLDATELQSSSTSLSIEAVAFKDQRTIRIDRVLVGRDAQ